MTAREVVLVTRRAWPARDDAALAFQGLASGLAERGVQVTVLTALWLPDGPRVFQQGGWTVEHIASAPRGGCETFFYGRALARSIRARATSLDAAIVSGLGSDAYAVLAALRPTRVPVVLRVERTGWQGDCHHQLTERCGARIKRRCLSAAAWVAPSPLAERELIAAGYPRPGIVSIPPGVPLPPRVSIGQRREVRWSLSQVDPALACDASSRVVLVDLAGCSPATWDSWLGWCRSGLATSPEVRWWLSIEAPRRSRLAAAIAAAGLAGRAVIVEDFEDPSDVFAAADTFVQATPDDEPRWTLLAALAQGIPAIVAVSPGHDPPLDDGAAGLTFPADDWPALGRALSQVLSEPEWAARLGETARAWMAQRHDPNRVADAWCELLMRLIARRREEG